MLYHFPNIPDQPLRPKYANFPWLDDPQNLKNWQFGKTGYPMVDAGMRQLYETGWMHNRVRMVVASFLVKHLLLPWQEGARWFWDTLVDADLASNTQGWQWAAGCGADAAPYFRIFNPITQGDKFDARGEYARRWIPELEKVPKKFVFSPWTASSSVLSESGVCLGENYPEPCVDHSEARARALAALAQTTLAFRLGNSRKGFKKVKFESKEDLEAEIRSDTRLKNAILKKDGYVHLESGDVVQDLKLEKYGSQQALDGIRIGDLEIDLTPKFTRDDYTDYNNIPDSVVLDRVYFDEKLDLNVDGDFFKSGIGAGEIEFGDKGGGKALAIFRNDDQSSEQAGSFRVVSVKKNGSNITAYDANSDKFKPMSEWVNQDKGGTHSIVGFVMQDKVNKKPNDIYFDDAESLRKELAYGGYVGETLVDGLPAPVDRTTFDSGMEESVNYEPELRKLRQIQREFEKKGLTRDTQIEKPDVISKDAAELLAMRERGDSYKQMLVPARKYDQKNNLGIFEGALNLFKSEEQGKYKAGSKAMAKAKEVYIVDAPIEAVFESINTKVKEDTEKSRGTEVHGFIDEDNQFVKHDELTRLYNEILAKQKKARYLTKVKQGNKIEEGIKKETFDKTSPYTLYKKMSGIGGQGYAKFNQLLNLVNDIAEFNILLDRSKGTQMRGNITKDGEQPIDLASAKNMSRAEKKRLTDLSMKLLGTDQLAMNTPVIGVREALEDFFSDAASPISELHDALGDIITDKSLSVADLARVNRQTKYTKIAEIAQDHAIFSGAIPAEVNDKTVDNARRDPFRLAAFIKRLLVNEGKAWRLFAGGTSYAIDYSDPTQKYAIDSKGLEYWSDESEEFYWKEIYKFDRYMDAVDENGEFVTPMNGGAYRWEVVDVQNHCIINNGVDLPIVYKSSYERAVPLYSLRENGVISVGTIGSYQDRLFCGDLTTVVDGFDVLFTEYDDPYGWVYDSPLYGKLKTQRYQYRMMYSAEGEPKLFNAGIISGDAVVMESGGLPGTLTVDPLGRYEFKPTYNFQIGGDGSMYEMYSTGAFQGSEAYTVHFTDTIKTVDEKLDSLLISGIFLGTYEDNTLPAKLPLSVTNDANLEYRFVNSDNEHITFVDPATAQPLSAGDYTVVLRPYAEQLRSPASVREFSQDGSRILKMVELSDKLVAYRDTGFFFISKTNSAENPFAIEPRYEGGRVADFRHTITLVNGDTHIFMGNSGIYSINRSSSEPQPVQIFELGPPFWQYVPPDLSEYVYSVDNPVTREVFINCPNGFIQNSAGVYLDERNLKVDTPKLNWSVLAYDYIQGTLSEIDASARRRSLRNQTMARWPG